jgi:peptide/nickel transport system permease protein
VSATLQIAFAILSETTLSFLGLGIQSPDTSLGLLIEAAGASAFNEHWYLFYIPGFMIILIALTINFIGDGLRDAMDPRQTMVRRSRCRTSQSTPMEPSAPPAPRATPSSK